MAINGMTLLVLLLACCFFVPTLARSFDVLQRSSVQSEDANRELASRKQGPISSFAETGHAQEISVLPVLGNEVYTFLYEAGQEEKPLLHEAGHEDKMILKSASQFLSSAEDGSSLHNMEMFLPSMSLTEDLFIHESELFLNNDDPISSLLDQNGLPIGLLPSSVANYTITDGGEFSVSLQKACYVKFDYEVYYADTITGKLSYGTISDLSGIQAKEAFFWVPVTGIRTDIPSSEYIYFDVGPISKKLSISQFQAVPICKVKAMAFSALA